MQIDVLGSSSLGNAYIISDGTSSILLECGIPYKEMQKKSNFKVNDVLACFVSHEHKDHSKAIKDLLGAAIDVYALPETLSALNMSGHYRSHSVELLKPIIIGTFEVLPIPMHHDVPCVGYLVRSAATKEQLFFATDTYKITVNPTKLDYLILEINYQKEIVDELVNDGILEQSIRARLLFSHLELSVALNWLSRIDKTNLKRIYVAHLSGGHSNAETIRKSIIAETGIPTKICDERKELQK